MTTLDGTLARLPGGVWTWRDGTPEPRVHDLSHGAQLNLRCRTTGSSRCYVEVPRGLAREEEDMAWIVDAAREGRYAGGQSGDHTGPRVLVALSHRADGSIGRAHIRPGEDPLLGAEPLPEIRGPIPSVILVPVEDWDAWDAEHPYGCEWDAADERDILQRAWTLGWRPPAGWRSAHGWTAPAEDVA